MTESNWELQHYGWGHFIDWANDNGVSLECEEDWIEWWQCWKASRDAKKVE